MDLEKQLEIVNNDLNKFAKQNYFISNAHSNEDDWAKIIQDGTQYEYLPELDFYLDTLRTNKVTFLRERAKYQFYVDRCVSFNIVKKYNSKRELLDDNRKIDIYYDSEFDTTLSDLEIASQLLISLQTTNANIKAQDSQFKTSLVK